MVAVGPCLSIYLSAPVVYLHISFSVGEKLAQPLCACKREASVDYSDKQVFPPDTVKCLGVVKEGQDGLLWLGSLVSVTDRLREAQDLVHA